MKLLRVSTMIIFFVGIPLVLSDDPTVSLVGGVTVLVGMGLSFTISE